MLIPLTAISNKTEWPYTGVTDGMCEVGHRIMTHTAHHMTRLIHAGQCGH